MEIDSIDLMDSKATRTTNKNIVWLKKFQDDIFVNIEMITYWIDPGQSKLTCQIHDPSQETVITS